MPKILVVEDYPELSDFLAVALTDFAGFEVVRAANGDEAISLLVLQRPDFALIDVKIPGKVQGIDIAERALALNVPILLMTGDFAVSDQLTENSIPHFLKPFHPAELFAAVERELARTKEDHLMLRRSLARLSAARGGLTLAHQDAARTIRREEEARQKKDKKP